MSLATNFSRAAEVLRSHATGPEVLSRLSNSPRQFGLLNIHIDFYIAKSFTIKLAHRIWIRLAVFIPLAIPAAFFLPKEDDEYLPFSASMVAGDHFAIDANKLHPTQMTVSFREVAHKAWALHKTSPANVILFERRRHCRW